MIYRTLVDTIPVLSSFGVLLIILLFMFTTVSVQLFALVDINPIPGLEREMDKNANFRDFSTAFLTLFRCSSGEGWNNIMFETSYEHKILFQCEENETYEKIIEAGRNPNDWHSPRGCGTVTGSYIFFSIF